MSLAWRPITRLALGMSCFLRVMRCELIIMSSASGVFGLLASSAGSSRAWQKSSPCRDNGASWMRVYVDFDSASFFRYLRNSRIRGFQAASFFSYEDWFETDYFSRWDVAFCKMRSPCFKLKTLLGMLYTGIPYKHARLEADIIPLLCNPCYYWKWLSPGSWCWKTGLFVHFYGGLIDWYGLISLLLIFIVYTWKFGLKTELIELVPSLFSEQSWPNIWIVSPARSAVKSLVFG